MASDIIERLKASA